MATCAQIHSIKTSVVIITARYFCAILGTLLQGNFIKTNFVHSGYPYFSGQVLSGDDIWTIFQGLVKNNITDYTHLLTGYSKTASSLRTVVKIRDTLRQNNPNLIHVCDPVMGDNGKLYVSEELVDIYKNEVIPGADFLKPNQTECEFLTGIKINDESDAIRALDVLHGLGVRTVVISSLAFEGQSHIVVLGSTKTGDKIERFKIKVDKVPELNGPFSGTGDLFSAVLLGWSLRAGSFKEAVEKSVATLHSILTKTHDEQQSNKSGIAKEIKLIQCRTDIESPKIVFKAQIIE